MRGFMRRRRIAFPIDAETSPIPFESIFVRMGRRRLLRRVSASTNRVERHKTGGDQWKRLLDVARESEVDRVQLRHHYYRNPSASVETPTEPENIGVSEDAGNSNFPLAIVVSVGAFILVVALIVVLAVAYVRRQKRRYSTLAKNRMQLSFPYCSISTKDLLSHLRADERLERPDNCSEELYGVMSKCWCIVPERRPAFSVLAKDLGKVLEEKQPTRYLQLDFSSSYKMWDLELPELTPRTELDADVRGDAIVSGAAKIVIHKEVPESDGSIDNEDS